MKTETKTIDPIEFLAKVGIYKEGGQLFKVQVVGVRQPDENYLFLQLELVGELLAEAGKKGLVYRAPDTEERQSFTRFEFGGAIDSISVLPESVHVMYVGELIFSPALVARFEEQSLSVEDL